MAEPSPFVLSAAAKASNLRPFYAAHCRVAGRVGGTVAFAGTLRRFVSLRRRIGRSTAPMTDDSVALAVAMYRTLRGRFGSDDALGAVQDAIVSSGLAVMADWVPENRDMASLGTQVRLIMGDAEQRGVYVIEAMDTTDTGIRWDITACRYAELTADFGAPEVGKVFCAVDQPFVAGVIPEVPFSCDTTIARGQDRCRFRIGDAVSVP